MQETLLKNELENELRDLSQALEDSKVMADHDEELTYI